MNTQIAPKLHSGIYTGWVHHLRETPKKHGFRYRLGIWGLDLDEIDYLESISPWFSAKDKSLINFCASDYLPTRLEKKDKYCAFALKQRVLSKVVQLGGLDACDRVFFVGQIRHFGIYFSPVNFFFCYVQNKVRYMLAEVSNTPWNERYYYLVDLLALNEFEPNKVLDTSDKAFHVSPFMDLNMKYLWRIIPPAKRFMVSIESQVTQKNESQDLPDTSSNRLFTAKLQLERIAFNRQSISIMVKRFPLMTLKILLAIYWQALLLFVKKIPFIPHSKEQRTTGK